MGRLMPYKYSGKVDREKNDQYFTPSKPVERLCKEIICIKPYNIYYPYNILDPCAGTGIWGATYHSLNNRGELYGVDIDPNMKKPEAYDYWDNDNFLTMDFRSKKFDVIISNPPFKHAEEFVVKGLSLLAEGGHLAYLLPLAFMSTVGRFERLFNNGLHPDEIMVSSRRIDFTGQGNPHTDVAMFVWYSMDMRKYGSSDTIMHWFDWEKEKSDDEE